jgi:Eukaryotic-type carbonic anhydrase
VIKRLTSILHHLQNLKACSTQNHFEKVYVDVDQLLPSVKTTYCYDGSLTTPPCSERVKWIILTAPIQLSNQQISAFQKIIHHNRVNDLVWGKDPFELRKLNEQLLKAMGVDSELSKRFLDHKILTPSDQTHIVAALDSLGKIDTRSEFIRAAISASSQDEVLLYRDSATILEKMAKSGSAITSFVPNPRLAMIRSGNNIVVILPADRLYYTESFDKALQKFLKNFQAELAKASKKELWLSGDATKRSRIELEKRGWTIRENLL